MSDEKTAEQNADEIKDCKADGQNVSAGVTGKEKSEVSGEELKGEEKPEKTEEESKEDKETGSRKKLEEELAKKDAQLGEYIELAQRVKAEFDNYRKRTAREKEQLYSDIRGDIILKFLPVLDNLERAGSQTSEVSDLSSVIDGMNMILKQFKDILAKEGVEEIEADGKNFDPNLHNAVMHIEDESAGNNTIVEVFQKGYKLKDKVLRHSMVKVAN